MKNKHGFTIVELLIAITIIGIIAAIVFLAISNSRERSYRARADAELLMMANATKLYVTKYNVYPPDVNRDIPAEIKEFLASDDIDQWPNAPWPDSVYDYDIYDNDTDATTLETVQISIRFCPISGPADLSDCKFPNEPWAENFERKSSYYYCIKGNCKAHENVPNTFPGFCVNCPNNKAIGT